jgi:t-SNARE complex subunit (syntaxin)
MPSQLQRRHRTRGWAVYGVTVVIIVVIVVAVQMLGHETSVLVSRINQGLTH